MAGRPIFAFVPMVFVLLTGGCVIDDLFPEDPCADILHAFGPLQPGSGGSNATFARVAYACATPEVSLDDYAFSFHYAESGHFNWPEEFPYSSPRIIVNASELSPEDGGSAVFLVSESGTARRQPADAENGAWIVRFDHWREFRDDSSRVRPGIAVMKDGSDADAEPDALPFGVYAWHLSLRDGTAGLIVECPFSPSDATAGCKWWEMGRYRTEAEGSRVHVGWHD